MSEILLKAVVPAQTIYSIVVQTDAGPYTVWAAGEAGPIVMRPDQRGEVVLQRVAAPPPRRAPAQE